MSIFIPEPEGGVSLAVAAQRRQTDAFIDVFPTTLYLVPRSRVKTATGGSVFEEQEPRGPQRFTFIEPTGNPTPTVTLDGVERRVEMEIVGAWDAEVARYDVFTHQGKDWEVVELFYDNGYETRAWVAGRG